MPAKHSPAVEEVTVREARPEDAQSCGQICFEAFSTINAAHGFPCNFPSPEATAALLSMIFSTPGLYGVVAESGGRIVGSNAIDERAIIAGIGPITVDPAAQNLGVGRKLMEAVMARARERGAAGTRLVQAAFHNRSLSLYTSLGFDVREPLSCINGRAAPAECSRLRRPVPHSPLTWMPATRSHGGCMGLIEALIWRIPSNRARPP